MMAKLTGRLEAVAADWVVVETVSGVGYRVHINGRTASALPPLGEACSFRVVHLVREDSHTLHGFLSEGDRAAFERLLTVSGVSARLAHGILDVLDAAMLDDAVAMSNANAFRAAKGVGPKLAQRLVTELQDKTAEPPVQLAGAQQSGPDESARNDAEPTSEPTSAAPSAPPSAPAKSEPGARSRVAQDTVKALEGLGFDTRDALRAVSETGSDAKTLEEALRRALAWLSPS
jgi:Holliday junction DNA helicase RuvA